MDGDVDRERKNQAVLDMMCGKHRGTDIYDVHKHLAKDVIQFAPDEDAYYKSRTVLRNGG